MSYWQIILFYVARLLLTIVLFCGIYCVVNFTTRKKTQLLTTDDAIVLITTNERTADGHVIYKAKCVKKVIEVKELPLFI